MEWAHAAGPFNKHAELERGRFCCSSARLVAAESTLICKKWAPSHINNYLYGAQRRVPSPTRYEPADGTMPLTMRTGIPPFDVRTTTRSGI